MCSIIEQLVILLIMRFIVHHSSLLRKKVIYVIFIISKQGVKQVIKCCLKQYCLYAG